jgi:hypothetical protein
VAVGRLGAAVLVVVAVVVALPLATKGAAGPVTDGGGRAALPTEVYGGWWWQASVRDHPAGRAVFALSGTGRGAGGYFENTRGAVTLVGRSGAYRVQRYAEPVTAGRTVLLSPDGGALAATVPDRKSGKSIVRVPAASATPSATPRSGQGVWITDLSTGRTGAIPVPGSAGLTTLGWSPQGTVLALYDRDPGGGRVLRLDVNTGATRTLLDVRSSPGDTPRAAWSPDGSRLAVQWGTALWAVDVDSGATRVLTVGGALLAGPGAFSGDGSTLAVLTPSGCLTSRCDAAEQDRRVWRLGYLSATTGASAGAPDLPTVTGADVRMAGTTPSGAVAVTVDPARAGPTRLLRLRTASRPGDLVDVPYGTAGVDPAADLVRAGRTGGSSPRPVPWPVAGWVTVPLVIGGALLVVAIIWLFRRRAAR